MGAVEGDGIDQELTRAVSAAMIAAARAGEQIARMHQTAARKRQARAAGDTVEAQRQLNAHTESARAYFEIVTRPEYLSAATDAQIQEVARQAYAWRERLPEAQRAEQAATGELGERQAPRGRDVDASRLELIPVDLAEQCPAEGKAVEQVAAITPVAQARPARGLAVNLPGRKSSRRQRSAAGIEPQPLDR